MLKFDDHTIKFTLVQPMAPFIDDVVGVKIIPEHIWKDVSDPNKFETPEAVIGTGPYKLEAYSKEHGTYKFVAFDGFWGPTQRVKNIEFIPVSDAIAAFQQKEIDFVPLATDAIGMFKNDLARIGELSKERLKEAGIDVVIQAVDSKSRDTKLAQGDFEIAINGYGGWSKDADYLRSKFCGPSFGKKVASHGNPLTGYQNDTVDKLALAQLSENDKNKRRNIIYQLQEVLAEEVPDIPLFYTASYNAYRPAVYDGWMNMFDHHEMTHSKLSYLNRSEIIGG